MTRDEHLTWCKRRALDYLRRGRLDLAVGGMGADLAKHRETIKLARTLVMAPGLLCAMNGDAHGVRRWIEDVNNSNLNIWPTSN
jgi:hypothetical protein